MFGRLSRFEFIGIFVFNLFYNLKMRKYFLFSIVALLLCQGLSAKTRNKNIDRHEFSIGYGVMPISEWNGTFTNAIKYPADYEPYDFSKSSHYGAVSLDYNFRLNKRIGVGVGVVYAYAEKDVSFSPAHIGNMTSKENNNFLSIMPKVKLNWIEKPNFTLYSTVGLGLCIDFYNTVGINEQGMLINESSSVFMLAYQFSPIGIEVGKKVAFFMEAGIGNAGSVVMGVRAKF